MKRVASLGLALTVGLTASCSEKSAEVSVPTTKPRVELEVSDVVSALQLYKEKRAANAAVGTKGPVIAVGTRVTAICFTEFSTDSRLDEVLVTDGTISGYSGVYSLDGSKDITPTPIFGQHTSEDLKPQLPSCK